MSFLVLTVVGEGSDNDEDDDVVDEDDEWDDGDIVVGLGVVLLQGELGAD